MNTKKLVSAILCVLSVASLFSGCQAAPDTAVVAGKNDGVFESALNSSAEPVENAVTEVFSYTNTFTSTDGKIEFNINDNSIKKNNQFFSTCEYHSNHFVDSIL